MLSTRGPLGSPTRKSSKGLGSLFCSLASCLICVCVCGGGRRIEDGDGYFQILSAFTLCHDYIIKNYRHNIHKCDKFISSL